MSAAAAAAASAASAADSKHLEGIPPELCEIADKVNDLVRDRILEIGEAEATRRTEAVKTLHLKLDEAADQLTPGTIMYITSILKQALAYKDYTRDETAKTHLPDGSFPSPDLLKLTGEFGARHAVKRAYDAMSPPAQTSSTTPTPDYPKLAFADAVAFESERKNEALSYVLENLDPAERDKYARYQAEDHKIRQQQRAEAAKQIVKLDTDISSKAEKDGERLCTQMKVDLASLMEKNPHLNYTYTWDYKVDRGPWKGDEPSTTVTHSRNPLDDIKEYIQQDGLAEFLSKLILFMQILELKAAKKPSPELKGNYLRNPTFDPPWMLSDEGMQLQYQEKAGSDICEIRIVQLLLDIKMVHKELGEMLYPKIPDNIQDKYTPGLKRAFDRIMGWISDEN